MKVEVLYLGGCPNYQLTIDRLTSVLRAEGLQADVSAIEVKDEAAARALKFSGSPTVRINGCDIEPGSGDVAGMACRWYAGRLPSEELIRAAVREARER